MSSWFFLVFINDLISSLRQTDNGLSVHGITIPTVLLADDTTLVSTSPKGLQKSLDTVYSYANKWRLTYNPTKSTVVTFSKSKRKLNTITYTLGNENIASADSTTYGGIHLTSDLSCKSRIEKYCQKARQSVNSLRSLGMNSTDLHPATCVKIWQRMILKTSLYGCELLYDIKGQQLVQLENTQRYFARTILGLDKRSPSESTIANLGLWTMIGYIDKCKLQYLGSLCNISCNNLIKHIFCACVAYLPWKSTVCGDLLSVLDKYNLKEYLRTYVDSGKFPPKHQWKRIVTIHIHKYEEQMWRNKVLLNASLSRYSKIHSQLSFHTLIHFIFLYPEHRKPLQLCLKVSSRNKTSRECSLCLKHAYDYDNHIILHCEKLLLSRNQFF